jgi:hypothetical protein
MMQSQFSDLRDYLEHNESHTALVLSYLYKKDGRTERSRTRAFVRNDLTVKELRLEMLTKFASGDAAPSEYGLFLGQRLEPLPLSMEIRKFEAMSEISLRLKADLRSAAPDDLAFVIEDRHYSFETPAIIGRHTDDMTPDQKREIQINLRAEQESQYISRKHAQIDLRNGQYIINWISRKSGQKLLVNDKEVPEGGTILEDGDVITLGTVRVVFERKPKDSVS